MVAIRPRLVSCAFARLPDVASGLRQPPRRGDTCPLGRYAVHGHRLAAATASCLRFRDIPSGVAVATNRRGGEIVVSGCRCAFSLGAKLTKRNACRCCSYLKPASTVGRQCRPGCDSEAEAGCRSVASRWPWMAYRPSGTNTPGPALPFAATQQCAIQQHRGHKIRHETRYLIATKVAPTAQAAIFRQRAAAPLLP